MPVHSSLRRQTPPSSPLLNLWFDSAPSGPTRAIGVAAVPDHEAWEVLALFAISSGEARTTEIRVRPVSPYDTQRELPVAALRAIHPRQLAAAVQAEVPVPRFAIPIDIALHEFRDVRPGPPGRSDLAYACVASLYVDALVEPAPLQAVASRMQITMNQAREAVRVARKRELLGPSSRGRRGGLLTERAQRLLADWRVNDHGPR